MTTSVLNKELDTYSLLLKQLNAELEYLDKNELLGSLAYETSLRELKKTVGRLININLDEIAGNNSRKIRYQDTLKKQIKLSEDERQMFKYNTLK